MNRRHKVFTDRRGRHWICGRALLDWFGIREVGSPRWWNYDELCWGKLS